MTPPEENASFASSLRRLIQVWKDEFVSLDRRNRLIHCNPDSASVVEFLTPDFDRILKVLLEDGSLQFAWRDRLLGEPETPETVQDRAAKKPAKPRGRAELLAAASKSQAFDPASQILVDLTDTTLGSRLRRLRDDARTAANEQGISILYVALGLIRWFEAPDSDVEFLSPLALLPVTLEKRGLDHSWTLKVADVPVDNIALGLRLREMGLHLPSSPDSLDGYGSYLAEVQGVLTKQPASRAEILRKTILGTFVFQKLAMLEDLNTNADSIIAQRLVRLIAGDQDCACEPSPLALSDSVNDYSLRPHDLFTVKDCDHSQLKAIAYARDGMDLVIDGPPGTGKSQTIANIIADCIARGKTVLFVSEKVAALDVVKSRLTEVGLGDFCLELHSHKQKRKDVLEELSRCLDLAGDWQGADESLLDRLEKSRTSVNDYVASLHRKTSGEDWSLFQVYGELAALTDAATVRANIPHLLNINATQLDDLRDLLNGFAAHADLISKGGKHPWDGLRTETVSLSQKVGLQTFFRASAPLIFQLRQNAEALDAAFGISPPSTLYDITAYAEYREKNPCVLFSIPDTWWTIPRDSLAKSLERFIEAANVLAPVLNGLPYKVVSSGGFDESLVELLLAQCQTSGAFLPNQGLCTLAEANEAIGQLLPALLNTAECSTASAKSLGETARLMALSPQRIASMHAAAAKWACTTIESILDIRTVDPNLLREPIRAEVRQCTEAFTAQETQASSLRAQLKNHFLPAAFTADGKAATRNALLYRRWWQRFGKKWKDARQVLDRFLATPPQSVGDLFGNLVLLAEWHECHRRAQDCVESCPVPVPKSASGVPDFPALLNQARLAEQFEKLGFDSKSLSTTCTTIIRGEDKAATVLAVFRSAMPPYLAAMRALPARTYQTLFGSTSPESVPLEKAAAAAGDAAAAVRSVGSAVNAVLAHLPELGNVPLMRLSDVMKAVIAARQSVESLAIDSATDDLVTLLPSIRAMRQCLADFPAAIPLLVRAAMSDAAADVRDAKALFAALPHAMVTNVNKACTQLYKVMETPERLGAYPAWSLAELASWVTDLTGGLSTLDSFLAFRAARAKLHESNLGIFAEMALSGQLAAADVRPAFDKAFFMQKANSMASSRGLSGFDLGSHEATVDRFRGLDRASHAVQRGRAREGAFRNRLRTQAVCPTGQERVLRSEAAKPRGRKKLRQIFAELPELLLTLKPCVMMSPLSVSTFFPGDVPELRFDIVVIDEASQVRPADAIPAIYRGNQLVVAGDDKQLPPTSFFARISQDGAAPEDEDGEDAASATAVGVESILDLCVAANVRRSRLLWHYRSRHESLIAFSNRRFYSNDLVTFPSAAGAGGVVFHHVPDGRWIDRTNPEEAQKIAQLVEQMVRSDSTQSIGIVTFNKDQQFLVEDELERLRQRLTAESGAEGLAEAVGGVGPEHLFVKNLENVQGDERDCIILGVGYARDRDGMFAMRFGPLNQAGGERRLNVAITRARKSMFVVSSVRADDFRVSGASPLGVQLLQAFLRFAEEGTLGPAASGAADFYDSRFEESVAKALRAQGLTVVTQVGCSRFRIDMAIVHPDDPTHYLLGVECDGATYHRSAVARDRDRLRQDVLEGLGWKIVRIWSTDWVRNPERQLARVVEAYRDAMARSRK
jgi:very-short-patch-repair endonuclease